MKYRVLSSRVSGAKRGSLVELPEDINAQALLDAGHVAPAPEKPRKAAERG